MALDNTTSPIEAIRKPFVRYLSQLVIMLLVLVILLFVRDQSYLINNISLIVVNFIFAIPIAVLLFWRNKLKRRTFHRVYINSESVFYNKFLGGSFLFIVQFFVATIFALNLIAGTILIEGYLYWLVLLFSPFVWILVGMFLSPYVNSHINEEFRVSVSSRLQLYITGALLMVIFVVIGFFSQVDDLRGVSFIDSYVNRTMSVYSKSFFLNIVVEFQVLIETLFLWLVAIASESTESMSFRLLTWVVALFNQWLFIWPLVYVYQFIQWMLYSNREINIEEQEVRQ